MLTDVQCRNALARPKNYKMMDGAGLYLEVTAKGSKYWRWKYFHFKKEKRISLGVYPSTSLAEARKGQEDAKDLLKQGIDPSLHRKEQKLLSAFHNNQTFEAVGKEWHNQLTGLSERYKDTLLRRMELDLFPAIGSYPISQLTPVIVFACIQKIEERPAYEMARRALQSIGQILRYATATGRAERDFTPDLKGLLKKYKTGHHASIEIDELPDLVKAINRNDARLYRQTILALRFLMLTFVRTSEMIQATHNEFDLEKAIWTIPAERMKMRHAHIVPLSQQAIEILKELKEIAPNNKYVFPSIPRPKDKHMSNNTILSALDGLKYKGKMTGHGFRALAMGALMEKLGWDFKIVDLQLAHKPKSKTEQAYNRAKFLPQRTKMMQDWTDYIMSLAN